LVPGLARRARVWGGAGDTVGVVAHVDCARAVCIRLQVCRAAPGVTCQSGANDATVQPKTVLARSATAGGGSEIADFAVGVWARLSLHSCQKRQRCEECARGNHFFYDILDFDVEFFNLAEVESCLVELSFGRSTFVMEKQPVWILLQT